MHALLGTIHKPRGVPLIVFYLLGRGRFDRRRRVQVGRRCRIDDGTGHSGGGAYRRRCRLGQTLAGRYFEERYQTAGAEAVAPDWRTRAITRSDQARMQRRCDQH